MEINLNITFETLKEMLDYNALLAGQNNQADSGLKPLIETLNTKVSQMDANLQVKIDALMVELEDAKGVKASVETFVASVPGLIQTAVEQAVAAGADPAQLQALEDLRAGLDANLRGIAEAVMTNPAPTPQPQPQPGPGPVVNPNDDVTPGGGGDTTGGSTPVPQPDPNV